MLRNNFTSPGKPYGETDPQLLERRESWATFMRLHELAQSPIQGPLDYDHMKAIHRHIFQDVFEWAGEERTAPTRGPMTKEGHAYFPAGPALTERAEQLYGQLADRDQLRGLPRDQFIPELAEFWGELNVVHSFREGNTRSQFAFFGQLADEAGYTLHGERFKVGAPLREEFVQARYRHQDTADSGPLARVLARGIEGDGPHRRTQSRNQGPTPPPRTLRDQIQNRAQQLRARHDDQPPGLNGPLRGRGPTR